MNKKLNLWSSLALAGSLFGVVSCSSLNRPESAAAEPAVRPAAEPATPESLGAALQAKYGIVLIRIPAGSFRMGSLTGSADERPVRQVAVTRDFCLGKCEVTQEQWQAVMGENHSAFTGAKLPVDSVSWDEARDFCGKLNREFAAQLPAGYVFDLPTEAQWEYACRAGSSGEYCGNNLNDLAWYVQNSDQQPHEAGLKTPNALGLCDMHGNAAEWCRDWYESYLGAAESDPAGPEKGTARVFRGGAWDAGHTYVRSACRNSAPPSVRTRNLGFRLALVPGR